MERGRFRKFWHSSMTRTASRRVASGWALRAVAACHTDATTNEPRSLLVSSPRMPLSSGRRDAGLAVEPDGTLRLALRPFQVVTRPAAIRTAGAGGRDHH